MLEVGCSFSPSELKENYVSGVYRIAAKKFNGAYIGESVNILKRWLSHISRLDSGRHDSYPLQRDWNKYGREAFVFEVLATEDDRIKRLRLERAWLIRQVIEGKSLYNSHNETLSAIKAHKQLNKGSANYAVSFLSIYSGSADKISYSECTEILEGAGIHVPSKDA